MLDGSWFSQFSLFFAKVFVVLIAFLICIAKIASSKDKSKANQPQLQAKDLKSVWEEQLEELADTIYDKRERKEQRKAQKAELKKDKTAKTKTSTCYVIRFKGDLHAKQTEALRHQITALCQTATKDDEVVIMIESPGGSVIGYGLAASQLERLRAHGIPLTVCIDQVAASGGYLMACVADKILAAPFAIVGSIGVLMQLPNFNKLLKKHGVEVEQLSAGEHKLPLTMIGENTKAQRAKTQEELVKVHQHFKDLIIKYRPQLTDNMDTIASGEYWHAFDALKLQLIDQIQTSDDYILNQCQEQTRRVIELSSQTKEHWLSKCKGQMQVWLQELRLP